MSDAIVGLCKACGSVRACIVEDVPEVAGWPNEVAKFCADTVRSGLRLERMTVEATRAANWSCAKSGEVDCPERPRRRKQAAVQGVLL